MTDNSFVEAYKTWNMANEVIIQMLKELIPGTQGTWYQRNAQALQARLAGHNPPMMICTEDEVKEGGK